VLVNQSWRIAGGLAVALLATAALWAQAPGSQNPQGSQNQQGGRNQPNDEEAEEEDQGPQLPDDQRLLKLHLDFVNKAEKLAVEYERNDETEKARVVYQEILKLVPRYPKALAALEKLTQAEATAEKKSMDVLATKSWQQTGIRTIVGKPIRLTVEGTWTLNMSYALGPDGMVIPEELRDYNLGALVAGIDTGDPEEFEPFLVGSELEFTADREGALVLGMWDDNHSDNAGRLRVNISGTFEKN